MRKFVFSFLVMLPVLSFTLSVHALAAESLNQLTITTDNHTASEEAGGKAIWEKLQAKEIECQVLTDDNYAALGEYFMGQSIGDTQRHAVMNQMMTSMMGEEGEKQMHIVMGKRMSWCNPNAPLSQNMMSNGMMMESAFTPWGFGGTKGGVNPMMGSFGINPMGTFGWGFGWIFMILFWVLVILAIAALVKWIANQGKGQNQSKPALPAGRSALDILKERYAKGEIDRKEFEEKKKDLS